MKENERLKQELKERDRLSCDVCWLIEPEEKKWHSKGARYVDEWLCFACPDCIPKSEKMMI